MTDDEIIRTVADDLPVGVWVARAPGGEFVYANNMFAEIMGISGRSDVAVGEYAAPYGIHGLDGALYPERKMPFVQALEARRTVVVDDIVIHRTDGRKVNIRAQARPVFTGDTISHIVIAFIDITREVDAKRAQEESERRLQRAQRLETVGTLAGGIAHDFNNLLATIKLTASTLGMEEQDPDKLSGLQLIDEVTSSATELTRALLGFARRGKNRAMPVSLNQVVASIGHLATRMLDRRIELEVLPAAARDTVIGDFSQLEQVVMNLVVNARDAMPDTGRLTLRTYEAEERVVLEVSDTGTGIPPEIRDRIFEPYFTTKTVGPQLGTGLGLATVYGIVESHSGSIDVLDNRPRGTTMRIELPLSDQRVEPLGSAPAPVVVPGSGKVLVIEDEPHVGAAVRSGLVGLGYEVLSAGSGPDGLELFRRHHLSLAAVVLDLVMPKMSGGDVYRSIRAIDPRVPVLLTTGAADNEDVQRLLDRGVAGFIPKPFNVSQLSEALQRVMTRAR